MTRLNLMWDFSFKWPPNSLKESQTILSTVQYSHSGPRWDKGGGRVGLFLVWKDPWLGYQYPVQLLFMHGWGGEGPAHCLHSIPDPYPPTPPSPFFFPPGSTEHCHSTGGLIQTNLSGDWLHRALPLSRGPYTDKLKWWLAPLSIATQQGALYRQT